MHWTRVILAWLLIIAAESVNGILRELFLAPVMGDLPARQLGVLTGSVLIFLLALATIRWIGASRPGEQLQAGLAWVVMTVCFEMGLGLALGYSAQRLLSDYDLSRGGFLGVGLLFMLLAPALAARLRRHCR